MKFALSKSERLPTWTAFGTQQLHAAADPNLSGRLDRTVNILAGNNGMLYVWNVLTPINNPAQGPVKMVNGHRNVSEPTVVESKLTAVVELPVQVTAIIDV